MNTMFGVLVVLIVCLTGLVRFLMTPPPREDQRLRVKERSPPDDWATGVFPRWQLLADGNGVLFTYAKNHSWVLLKNSRDGNSLYVIKNRFDRLYEKNYMRNSREDIVREISQLEWDALQRLHRRLQEQPSPSPATNNGS